MILALAVVLGLIAGLVRHRGRAFGRIAALPLRAAWLVLLSLALQLPLLRAPAGPVESIRLQQALFLVSYVPILVFVYLNRRQIGVLVIGAGVMCNLVAIAANAGLMPISPATLTRINPGSTAEQWPEGMHYGYSKDVIQTQADSHLWALSDVLVLPPPFPWPAAFSAGDVLIALGIGLLLQGPVAQSAGTDMKVSAG